MINHVLLNSSIAVAHLEASNEEKCRVKHALALSDVGITVPTSDLDTAIAKFSAVAKDLPPTPMDLPNGTVAYIHPIHDDGSFTVLGLRVSDNLSILCNSSRWATKPSGVCSVFEIEAVDGVTLINGEYYVIRTPVANSIKGKVGDDGMVYLYETEPRYWIDMMEIYSKPLEQLIDIRLHMLANLTH